MSYGDSIEKIKKIQIKILDKVDFDKCLPTILGLEYAGLDLEKLAEVVVGSSMPHADALSRTEAVGAISEIDLDFQLQIVQARDPTIESFKRKLEQREVDGFLLRDGLVYHSHNISYVLNAMGSPQANGQVERVNRYLSERVDPIARDFEAMRARALENIEDSQLRNEEYFHRKHKSPCSYEEGDLVAVRYVDTTDSGNKKLQPKYRGPYVVHKILPHDRYVIRDVEECQLTQLPYDGVLEVNKLRPWTS
ncbi:uncharacterized protein LOC131285209 [Anopheles ziemanni]|uniref:uncharacterized protein LOC131264819 n=1 Tax=Anopheles coustani TaxID=139045 RepID=UPI00265AC2B6|nr:uncharacterized protein LOC131264819 [Anopheles coustani]XP_058170052.1 uncharacterized protein LOC131285209 [Anopheles ziemanni]